MPTPVQGRKLVSSNISDPFAGHHQEAVYSTGSPGATYLGRVVIELWNSPTSLRKLSPVQRDTAGMTLYVEPTEQAGDADSLLKRVEVALSRRVAGEF